MSKLEKLKEKARSLEAKDAKAAIAAWLDVIKEQESERDPNPDLSVFNRIGDLAAKVKDSAGAAEWYDRAVAKYAAPAEDDPTKSGKHKTTSLVFPDVDAPPASKTKPAAPGAPRRPTPPPPPIRTPSQRPPSREPEHLKPIEDVMPDPDLSLEI